MDRLAARDVIRAQMVVRRFLTPTPLYSYPALNQVCNAEVYVKHEKVLHAVGLGLDTDLKIGRVSLEDVYHLARQADRPDAEAIFISCTGLRTIGILDRLEHDLGKPVVSANQASFWDCLRLAGVPDRIAGYGQLFGSIRSREQGSHHRNAGRILRGRRSHEANWSVRIRAHCRDPVRVAWGGPSSSHNPGLLRKLQSWIRPSSYRTSSRSWSKREDGYARRENVGSENALSCPRHTAWCPPRRRVMAVGRHVTTVAGV
jgi:Arylmalonate decarboxylase